MTTSLARDERMVQRLRYSKPFVRIQNKDFLQQILETSVQLGIFINTSWAVDKDSHVLRPNIHQYSLYRLQPKDESFSRRKVRKAFWFALGETYSKPYMVMTLEEGSQYIYLNHNQNNKKSQRKRPVKSDTFFVTGSSSMAQKLKSWSKCWSAKAACTLAYHEHKWSERPLQGIRIKVSAINYG